MWHSPFFFSALPLSALPSLLFREPLGLSVFSDEETDLIRELQTMCSSKSEPDISKVCDAITVLWGFQQGAVFMYLHLLQQVLIFCKPFEINFFFFNQECNHVI